MELRRGDGPELILGTAQLVSDYGVTRQHSPAMQDDDAKKFLLAANTLGISVLDTAPAYGRAEEVIGQSETTFTIHTKVSRELPALQSLQRSLARLGAPEVDVLYVHDIDGFRTGFQEMDRQLGDCLREGAHRVGVSVYTPSDVELVLCCENVSVIQIPLNILDRRFVALLPKLKDRGLSIIVRSVFLQGVLLARPEDLPAHVRHLESHVGSIQALFFRHGVDLLQGCLAFVEQFEHVDGVIVGAQSEDELKAIVKAWSCAVLDDTDLSFLSDVPLPEDFEVDPRFWSSQRS